MQADRITPSGTKIRKVTFLPPFRPSAPPRKVQSVANMAPERRCASADACPAVREIGRPEKLARDNRDDYCYRCRSRRADETTKDLDTRRRGGAARTSV